MVTTQVCGTGAQQKASKQNYTYMLLVNWCIFTAVCTRAATPSILDESFK